jgi:hypothetical protein
VDVGEVHFADDVLVSAEGAAACRVLGSILWSAAEVVKLGADVFLGF